MSKVNWKDKYMELRSKYMNATDVAFRLGVEEGQKNAQFEQAQMELQQMQEQMAMQAQADPMMGGEEMPPEAMGEEGMGPEQELQEMVGEEQGGADLDSSIDELESYVKSEEDYSSLLKSLHSQSKQEPSKLVKSEKIKVVENLIKSIEKSEDKE
jgi:hypothetical protein